MSGLANALEREGLHFRNAISAQFHNLAFSSFIWSY